MGSDPSSRGAISVIFGRQISWRQRRILRGPKIWLKKCLIFGEQQYFYWNTASQSTKWPDMPNIFGGISPWAPCGYAYMVVLKQEVWERAQNATATFNSTSNSFSNHWSIRFHCTTNENIQFFRVLPCYSFRLCDVWRCAQEILVLNTSSRQVTVKKVRGCPSHVFPSHAFPPPTRLTFSKLKLCASLRKVQIVIVSSNRKLRAKFWK